MQQPIIYALDFDGVLCDSAIETGLAGWKAARKIWTDIPQQAPHAIIEQFRQARPILETGFEAIIVIRALLDKHSVNTLLTDFEDIKANYLAKMPYSIEQLKKLFGDTRDQWIKQNPDDWADNNPLFVGITEKLISITDTHPCYILTTKQERFVSQIFHAHQINFPAENIFGLERNKSKEILLMALREKHPDHPIYFVEDRLPPLLKARKNPKLSNTRLFFATWGYNTEEDIQQAEQNNIECIDLNQFILL